MSSNVEKDIIKTFAIVNLQPTPFDRHCDLRLHEEIDKVVEFVSNVEACREYAQVIYTMIA